MKLILKSKDSVTSVLLFIFNNYLCKYEKDYIELQHLIKIMKVFNKNESTTRMAISRAVKNGILINEKKEDKVFYRISDEGRNYIQIWNKNIEGFWTRYKYREAEWNDKWCFVIINITKEINNLKREISEKFMQLGLIQYNTNMWISPYYQKETIKEIVDEYNLFENITEFYGEITVHKDMDTFLRNTFSLEKLRGEYLHFIKSHSDELKKIQKLKESYFNYDGQALASLYELGYDFYNIASNDAVLPKKIIDPWEGDEAAFIMNELRNILLKYVYEYFEKLD